MTFCTRKGKEYLIEDVMDYVRKKKFHYKYKKINTGKYTARIET